MSLGSGYGDHGAATGTKPLEQPLRPPVAGNRKQQPQHWFEPYFPVAMQSLNDSVDDRLSDHCPMTVDMSLTAIHPHAPIKHLSRKAAPGKPAN